MDKEKELEKLILWRGSGLMLRKLEALNKKIKLLNKLKEKVEKCQHCPLYKTRTKIVFGAGPISPKIMSISEAPGYWEDQKGLPFVGRAGKLLDKLLDTVGLKREAIYITNVIKCRPPKNRKPKKEEIEACLPYLKKQVEIINPPKFILLGQVAFSVFFPNKKLKDSRGKWIKKDNKEFFITYHPAAGLRFQKMRKVLEKDFKRLKKLN